VAGDDDMKYNAWLAKPVLLYNLFTVTREQVLGLFRPGKDQFHLYCNIDLLKQFYPGKTQEELNDTWRKTFNRLFTFDDYFANYAGVAFNGAKNICGIHLRFISLLGDFKEVVNRVLPDEKKNGLIHKCIHHVKHIIEMCPYEKYLVVSDSIIFLQTLKELLHKNGYAEKVIILDGPIAHIDVDHSEDVLQKAVLDFYLLSRCCIVYQVLADKMYKSQFCRYAAVLGNAPYCIEKI
jgi:hypothetical protein